MRRFLPTLPRTVVLLGITSFFTDVGSEMGYALLPSFLVTSLGASPLILGWIEGASDAVASVLKWFSGAYSDRLKRRKPLILSGYGLAAFVRPFLSIATSPLHILGVRLLDRVGKGVRTSPRDALIADSVPTSEAGRAFGFHRAMDHLGGVVGPLFATLFLLSGFSTRKILLIAGLPGLFSILAILWIREEKSFGKPSPSDQNSTIQLPLPLKSYLWILFLFSLGNSSDAFLILRAQEMGVAQKWIALLWAIYHAFKSTLTYVVGAASDRIQRTWMIQAGWIVFAFTYLGFALFENSVAAWGFFLVYSLYYALTEPAEKAFIHELAPQEIRGKAYGIYNFILGGSSIPASVLTGWLWKTYGASMALSFGAGMALFSSLVLFLWSKSKVS